MKTILLKGPFTKEDKIEIQNISNDIKCIFKDSKDITIDDIKKADAIVGNIKVDLLKENSHLEWLHLTSAGVNQYVNYPELFKNTLLTCSSGAYGVGISEYLITYMLMIMKKIPTYLNNASLGLWKDEGEVTSPIGKRVLVIGTGNLGEEFAKRVKALGSYTIGINKSGRDNPYFDEIYTIDVLKEEIRKADVIVITLPETKETYHLFNDELFSLCKENSILMNVGRGNIINTDSLLKYHHKFKGIYLDVVENEPLSKDHPLWNKDNIYITPHITGGNHLDITVREIVDITKFNIKAYINHTEFKNIVDLKKGYVK